MHIEPGRGDSPAGGDTGAPSAFEAGIALPTRPEAAAGGRRSRARTRLAEPVAVPAAGGWPRGASEEMMRVTFELAPIGLAHVAPDGRILLVNARFCELLGYPRDELLALAFRDITHPDDCPADSALAARLLSDEAPVFGVEKRYIRKDGAPLWTALTATLARDAAGAPHHFIVIVEDISARKRAEAERAEAERAELLARERAAAERVHALQIITDTALAHVALDDLMPRLLDSVLGAMAVDSAIVLLLDERAGTLAVRAARGIEIPDAPRVRIPLGQGVAGIIAAEGRPLIVDDLSTAATFSPSLREHLRSLAGVPLVVEGRVAGVVHVGTVAPRHFAEEDVRLLELVAERVALAIGQARLYEEARRARDEAAARAAQLAATIDSMADGVVVHDAEGRVLRANEAARDLLGLRDEPDISSPHGGGRVGRWTLRDARGRPLSEDRMPLFRVLRGETLTGANAVDVTLTTHDRRNVELSLSAAPVLDAARQPVGGVLIYRDVTDRRRLERRTAQALRALLAMAETLVIPTAAAAEGAAESGAGEAVARLAELTRSVLGCQRVAIVSLDPAAGAMRTRAMVGFAPRQERAWLRGVEGRPPERCFAEGELAQLCAGEAQVVRAAGATGSDDWRIAFAPHDALLAPLRVGGQLAGLLGLDDDPSAHAHFADRMALADAVAKLAAMVLERERLLREREEARASELALRAANRQMDEFLSMASHELRTPLTSIKAYIQVAQRRLRQARPADAADAPGAAGATDADLATRLAGHIESAQLPLDRANEHSDVLNRLVGDLLDASRIQAHRLEIRPGPCDLAALVRAAVEEQLLAWPARAIEADIPPDARVPLHADAARLKQVVTNYLTNAIKYAPPDRPITARLDVLGAGDGRARVSARVSVRDFGPGLPPEEQSRIWDRFHRTEGVRVQNGGDGGLGLGLYISRGIVELHGGWVGVESRVGAGSTFFFSIPVGGAAPDAPEAPRDD